MTDAAGPSKSFEGSSDGDEGAGLDWLAYSRGQPPHYFLDEVLQAETLLAPLASDEDWVYAAIPFEVGLLEGPEVTGLGTDDVVQLNRRRRLASQPADQRAFLGTVRTSAVAAAPAAGSDLPCSRMSLEKTTDPGNLESVSCP